MGKWEERLGPGSREAKEAVRQPRNISKGGAETKKGEGQIHGNGKGWVLAGQIMRDSWQPPAGLCMQVLHSALKQCLEAIQLYASPHVASSKRVLLCLCLACLLSFV